MEPRDFDLTDPDAAAFCPSCGSAYTSVARDCGDCGVPLLARSSIESELAGPPEEDALADDAAGASAVCPACGAEYTASSLECVRCRVSLVSPAQIQDVPAIESSETPFPPSLSQAEVQGTPAEDSAEAASTVFGTIRDVARGSRGREEFTAPASLGRVVAYGSVCAVATAYVAAELLRGNTRFATFAVAVMFGLFALDHWRRLSTSHLLPPQFRCPDCDASIRLSRAERASTTFACKACGEDFEVDDSNGGTER